MEPMLATLADAPLVDPNLVYEPKYDGIRALVLVTPHGRTPEVTIASRRGNDKTAQFPEVVAALARWAKSRKQPALLEWQVFPSMQPNPEFVTALSGAVADKDTPLLFLCRSGVRSAAAAKAMTAAGYSACLNVVDGFEGPLDAQAKRGTAGGWKAAGLPWRQT